MLREGAGERLEQIAEEQALPATRVRQRVSRLRRHFRARYAAQLAAVAAIVAAVLVLAFALRKKESPVVRPLPPNEQLPRVPAPEQRAADMRKLAFEKCEARAWQECLDELDAAKQLDPAGDSDPRVRDARKAAQDALTPPAPSPSTNESRLPPAPTSTATALVPTASAAPAPAPKTKPNPTKRSSTSEGSSLDTPPKAPSAPFDAK
jgi:hypothetical protein